MRDLKNDLKAMVALKPTALSTTTDLVGSIIDLQGFDSCMFHVITPDIASVDLAAQLLIEHGDAANLSDASAVADADLIGLESDTAIGPATNGNSNLKVGYKGTKRYVRATLDVSANAAGTDVIACSAVLGLPALGPA